MYLAKVYVTLKPTVNDPQGLTVKGGLHTLGFEQVKSVRVGKYIEIQIEEEERIKAEAFRRYTTRRLDTHDQALGIDTRSADALPTEAPPRQLTAAPPPPPTAKMWYYEDSGNALGPVSIVQMRDLAKAGIITGQTLVWSDGMADWVPLAQLAELRGRVLA